MRRVFLQIVFCLVDSIYGNDLIISPIVLVRLAILYKEQGCYDEAEKLLSEAIEGHLLRLSDTHPHTIESMNNLIALYEAWNKPEEAEKLRAELPQMEPVNQ
jgi:tetratricopeptide (TPR) repeat protein